MNIVNKLTIRHLKLNKRRTLVTIIGVIISVAMITAVATISTSFLDLLQRQVISTDGEWHVQYQHVNKDQLELIEKNESTKELIISRDVGYAQLEGSQNKEKPYLFIKSYNTAGFENFPIELSEGRLPQAANEVVISDEIAETAQVAYKLGDMLTLDIGPRVSYAEDGSQWRHDQSSSLLRNDKGEILEKIEVSETKSYTIVGIIKRPTWEYNWAPGYTIITYTDASLLGNGEQATASVIVNKINRSLFTKAQNLAAAIGVNNDSLHFNYELLRYYGVTNRSDLNMLLYSMTAIIMSIIIVGSVSLIYNAFAISVSERSRHLGMLSSVGATRRQKRNSVFFEGTIIGLISIPLGIVSGLAGIGITFMFINSTIQGLLNMTESLKVTVTPVSILIACGVSILTIFISTYIPARRASKVTAIEAIRQTADVKLTGKAVKTSKLVRKIFGIEAEIGLKNLKRNKRRYKATVFSLVISIVLFLSVSYFTDNMKKSLEMSQSGTNYDIQLGSGNEPLDKEFVNSITAFEEVTAYSLMTEIQVSTMVDEAKIADPMKDIIRDESASVKGKVPYYVDLIGLDEKSLQAYANEAGFDADSLLDPNEANAVVVNELTYRDFETGKFINTKAIHTSVEESILLMIGNGDTGVVTELGSVKVAGLTATTPIGVRTANLGGITVIVSEHTLERLLGDTQHEGIYTAYSISLQSEDPSKTVKSISELDNISGGYYISNLYEARQQEQQMLLLMSVFTYGFILLITAISVANIFNTISTSISLRKRELAMLKSVGMTPKGFNKMINYESIFYGIKSLLYGLPISIALMYLMHRSLGNVFEYSFVLPWVQLLYVVIAVFIIVGTAMMYSSSKVKRENIIDAIKQESI